MMNNKALESYLNQLLLVERHKDYAPNGLQVEGRENIKKVVTGVSASLALIEAAIDWGADALIVHHGYFWKGEPAVLTEIKYRRIQALITHGINLYAYHLPLDTHATLGNNALLAKTWQIAEAQPIDPSSPNELLWTGSLPGLTIGAFAKRITASLAREPLVITGGKHRIKKVAWCSGAAQDLLGKAASLGMDAYVSGEVSERTFHEAKEYGIHYFSAGHHATEREGVRALAEHLATEKQLDCQFIDKENPI